MSAGTKKDFLQDWQRRCHIAQIGHYFAGSSAIKWHYRFGSLLIISTAILSAIQVELLDGFPFVDTNHVDFLKIIFTLVSTILANMQVFYDFSGRAASHQMYAGEYGKLKRDIEKLLVAYESNPENIHTDIDSIADNWNKIAIGAPITPKCFVRKAEKEVGRRLQGPENKSLCVKIKDFFKCES